MDHRPRTATELLILQESAGRDLNLQLPDPVSDEVLAMQAEMQLILRAIERSMGVPKDMLGRES